MFDKEFWKDDPFTYLDEMDTVPTGVYEVGGMDKLEVEDCSHDEGALKKIGAFLEKHPNAVKAQGYESHNFWLLPAIPDQRHEAFDARNFMYTTLVLNVERDVQLLFVLDH